MNDETLAAEAAEAEAAVAEAQTENPAEQAEETPSPETKVEEEKVNKVSASKRIGQLTRKRREAEEAVARLEAENAKLREKVAKAPKADEYDDPDQFTADQITHAVRAARVEDRDAEIEAAKTARDAASTEIAKEAQASFAARVEEFKKEAPDFEVFAYRADLPLSEEAALIVQSMEDGPRVAYHLGKNPEIAAEISALPPGLAGVELAKLAQKVAPAPRKLATSAPPPAGALSGAGGTTQKDPRKMTFKEYQEFRGFT